MREEKMLRSLRKHANLTQILHVHRHNNPHRQLAHHDRSFRPGPRQPRSPSHHEEAVGAEEEAGSRGVDVAFGERSKEIVQEKSSLLSSKLAEPHVKYYEDWE